MTARKAAQLLRGETAHRADGGPVISKAPGVKMRRATKPPATAAPKAPKPDAPMGAKG